MEAGEKSKAFKVLYKEVTLNEDYEIIKNLQLLDLYSQISIKSKEKKPFKEEDVVKMLR